MPTNTFIADQWDLEVGDVIAIMYRSSHLNGNVDAHAVRWLHAWIVDREAGSWPVARLADGQLTDVRPFMMWRHVEKMEVQRASRKAA